MRLTPTRVQCAFIDTPDVESINKFISEQDGYVEPYILPEPKDDSNDSGGANGMDRSEKLDPLFEEAARMIVIHQQGSTSLIQRKFSLGYNRAGKIMDQMERMGIVGAANGSKPRDVLVPDEFHQFMIKNHYDAQSEEIDTNKEWLLNLNHPLKKRLRNSLLKKTDKNLSHQ